MKNGKTSLFGRLWPIGLLIVGLAWFGGRPDAARAAETCDATTSAIAAARKAHDVGKFQALYEQAQKPASGCSGKAIFCLGRSLALGYLDEAYRRQDAGGTLSETRDLLTKGKSFGSPWQVLGLLGQVELADAKKTHDRAAYGQASLTLQEALIGLADEPPCAAFGEPGRPAPAAIEGLYRQMSTALLLAAPAQFVTTRCSPCQWMFLTGISGFEPASRPLPITFDLAESQPTAVSQKTIDALLDCLKARKITSIELSGHTDATGSDPVNMQLSKARLDNVRRLLLERGFKGTIKLEPKGRGEPYPAAETDGYSAEEIARMNRRIELRQTAEPAAPDCSG